MSKAPAPAPAPKPVERKRSEIQLAASALATAAKREKQLVARIDSTAELHERLERELAEVRQERKRAADAIAAAIGGQE